MKENEVLVKVENLSKKFCKDLKTSLWYGVKDLFTNVRGNSKERTLRSQEFWALKNINFELRRGECLGLIGHNGAGKSTLLKILNGLINPDEGKVTIKGRVGALIELGAGFNPILTGRENIYNNGAVLGFTKKEIDSKVEEIIDFAEIREFIEMPVQNYSSGMKVRLGFSVAAQMEPDVLIIDEVLAVGDINFQLKCFDRIGELRKNGVAIVLVSHNLHQITTFCNRGIAISKGNQLYYGEVEKSIEYYKDSLADFNSEKEIEKVITGNKNFIIKDVNFSPKLINSNINFNNETELSIKIKYETKNKLKNLDVDIVLRASIMSGIDFFQANNKVNSSVIDLNEGEGELSITLKDLHINGLKMYLFIAIFNENREECIFWWRNIPVKFNYKNFYSGITTNKIEFSIDD
ncbi:ABC transporter ATP-binding protein [Lutibacter sp. TH_r2]|uniref:ABC transporter ATP-binding protein n=1 Tax=Lutibacter sp. TH_r2 TaxID=3082083 RepID=UPI002952DBDF|nr:ABC transporter ATP-binding protein [Lutibacter sp. TH_r2]MDV7187435.1 ABC transporter ATP-binding protein [Lutibacter sp. TH_r2]